MSYDWRHEAACLGEDPELFHPVGTEGPAVVQAAAAQAVCARCPVREQCLEFGQAIGAKHGVWGGRWLDLRSRVPVRA